MSIAVRFAESGDLDRVNDLLYQVLSVHAEGRPDIFTPGRKKYSDSELLAIFEDERTPVLVCELDGRVVGYAFCIKKETKDHPILRDRRELYIDDLCVDREYRRQGIGGILYREVLRLAREWGFDAITLNVWALNRDAALFYERCGFTPLKTVMEYKLQ